MKKFAAVWRDEIILQQPVAKLPWETNIVLIDKVDTSQERIWYVQRALKKGWIRNILALQIDGRAYARSGKSVNNFGSNSLVVVFPCNLSFTHNIRVKPEYLDASWQYSG